MFPMFDLSGGQYTMRNDGANKIAILGGASTGWVGGHDTLELWESTDNGATWPPTASIISGEGGIQVGGDSLVVRDGLLDIMYLGGEPNIVINMMTADLLYKSCRIMFWNPTLGWKTAAYDTLQFTPTWVSQAGHLPVGCPSIGKSGTHIVVAFEGYPAGDQYQDTAASGRFRGEIFLTQSLDGGSTWTLPVNLTNTPEMDDKYPCVSKWNPDGSVYLVWQEDPHAGSSSRDDGEGPISYAAQKFMKVNLETVFPTNDITALQVTAPQPGNAFREGVGFTPKAAFRNIGLLTQTNIPVTFEILNGSNSVVWSDNKTIGSLISTATTEVTFASVPGSLLTYGRYTTRAYATNPGDSHSTNDSTRSAVQVIPVVPVTGTYTEDFEGAAETGGYGWFGAVVGASTISDWVRGTPAKTQITGAHGGTQCYVTKLGANYSDGQESFLGSPVFDFSSVTGNVRMEFYQNYIFEPLWDGGWLQYSVDGGLTWHVVDSSLATGPGWTTGMSTGWYNANVDSQVVTGAPAPPFWSDSTVLFAANSNGWIKSTTMLPVGGYSDVRLRFYMSADANQNREGWAIDDIVLKTGSGSTSVPYTNGWNMVANPVQTTADSVKQLYPASAFTYAFGFGVSGYFQQFKLANGPGYWAKFNTSGSQPISGTGLQSLSAPTILGWNMIGSMTTAVDTSNVYPSPYGARASVYFGYNGGYTATATLEPGKAYWVKASAPGAFLFLPPAAGAPAGKQAASPLAQLNTLTVKDAAGNSSTLYFGGAAEGVVDVAMYEMPPVPPAGAFDARFAAATGGYMVQTHEPGALTGAFPVQMQSAVYPVTVSWKVVSDAGYRLTDGVGGKLFGARELQGEGSMVIRNSAVSRLVVGIGGDALPKDYALMQNYPNPFNPSTTIKFALPEASRVTVEIYNLLGQKVSTLVSDQLTAGYHEVVWNGTTSAGQLVGSGIYFARFNALGAEGKSFTDVRKLMLMK